MYDIVNVKGFVCNLKNGATISKEGQTMPSVCKKE